MVHLPTRKQKQMKCQHEWWHRVRTRVAYKLMPQCERLAIAFIARQYQIPRLLSDYLTGPLHVKDQSVAALRDLGVNIIGKEET